MSPGAIMNTDGGLGNFSILGMPGNSNILTLNGMGFTGIGFEVNPNGASGLLLGPNEVQEATIVSNGYSGPFGVLAGAAVNYITKSGGNAFHGNSICYRNGRVLNANDWFNKSTGVPRPFDNANQWAGSVGGPIKKDKVFFFSDTEGLRLLVPSAPQQVVLPSRQFEAATITNIDSKFGATSASDAFYKQIFALGRRQLRERGTLRKCRRTCVLAGGPWANDRLELADPSWLLSAVDARLCNHRPR